MEPFKNEFSQSLVRTIGHHLQKYIADFDRSGFETEILKTLNELELKQRMQLIADQLHLVLPSDNEQRAGILLAILHPDIEAKNSDEQGICAWGTLPLTLVVGQHGLDDFENSLELLKKMSSYFSSEFAIRYFLLKDQNRALKIIKKWVKDENHHVRRLVSEGTRPRLPWAMQLPSLINDPAPILPILKSLRDDESEYVRRSVANHLNDIAKDHKDLVGEIANDCMKGANNNRQKLVRHACRSLIKQGHKNTLKAFGIEEPFIKIGSFNIKTPQVLFGENLKFDLEIISTSDKEQKLIIDYLVYFKKANGKLAAKVFKWTKFTLKPNEKKTFAKNHPIRPITTRKYYQGKQALSLRINGSDFEFEEFYLKCESTAPIS